MSEKNPARKEPISPTPQRGPLPSLVQPIKDPQTETPSTNPPIEKIIPESNPGLDGFK